MKFIFRIFFLTVATFCQAQSISYCQSGSTEKSRLVNASMYQGPLAEKGEIVPDDEKRSRQKTVVIYKDIKFFAPAKMYFACTYGDIKHPEVKEEQIDERMNQCSVTFIKKTGAVTVSCRQ